MKRKYNYVLKVLKTFLLLMGGIARWCHTENYFGKFHKTNLILKDDLCIHSTDHSTDKTKEVPPHTISEKTSSLPLHDAFDALLLKMYFKQHRNNNSTFALSSCAKMNKINASWKVAVDNKEAFAVLLHKLLSICF